MTNVKVLNVLRIAKDEMQMAETFNRARAQISVNCFRPSVIRYSFDNSLGTRRVRP
jgi:hypothetical protein